MIKNFTKFKIAKRRLLLNVILLIFSLCIVNISFAAEDFPWEIFYPAFIKKSIDKDKDGFTKEQGDCNDNDASINPGAIDTPYDGIDQDCSGADVTDVDGDNYDAVATGGDDCNDLDPTINPNATEICGDGIDQDCNGSDLPCPPCMNIAGSWYASETVTLTCCVYGDCETDTFSGTDTINIQQNGCNISYDVYLSGYGTFPRTGTINANKIQLSGLFAVLQPSCTATQNTIDMTGTVNGDQINLQGSGIIKGTCDGHSFSCTGGSTAILTRLSSSDISKAMIAKESIRESSTPLLNNCIKIFAIIDH